MRHTIFIFLPVACSLVEQAEPKDGCNMSEDTDAQLSVLSSVMETQELERSTIHRSPARYRDGIYLGKGTERRTEKKVLKNLIFKHKLKFRKVIKTFNLVPLGRANS